MLATVGDLVDDIIVRLDGPIRQATDTPARIERRRGGSAANVAAAARDLGFRARFIGQVGGDSLGKLLVDELSQAGVDVSAVRQAGRTGSIVVVVDEQGERSMLTDRGACADLDGPDEAWLHAVTTLHVPLYSCAGGLLADTSDTLVGWAHARGIAVSIDLSSVALIEALSVATVRALVSSLKPDVVFANADEAWVMGIESALDGALTVVKRGALPAIVHRPGSGPIEVPAIEIERVSDTPQGFY
jgi:sugar/nucleoside kinase (ribokinase family)